MTTKYFSVELLAQVDCNATLTSCSWKLVLARLLASVLPDPNQLAYAEFNTNRVTLFNYPGVTVAHML